MSKKRPAYEVILDILNTLAVRSKRHLDEYSPGAREFKMKAELLLQVLVEMVIPELEMAGVINKLVEIQDICFDESELKRIFRKMTERIINDYDAAAKGESEDVRKKTST